MKRAASFLLTFGVAASLTAQTITLKTGKVLEGQNLRLTGDTLMTTVQMAPGQSGTIGYPLSGIAKIAFPKPPAIQLAADQLAKGDALKALATINPVIAAQAPFRKIEGNWWAPAAAIKLNALTALRMNDQAAPMIADMVSFTGDPDVVRIGRVNQAISLVRKGEYDRALGIAKPITQETKSPRILAPAYLAIGDCMLAKKDYPAALLAYLRIPVFYPDEKIWMPGVLLGSARAYEGIEDNSHAQTALQELQKSYASAPEAGLSKDDLKRIDRKLKSN